MLKSLLPATGIFLVLTNAAFAMCGTGGMGGTRAQCGAMPGMTAGTAPDKTPDAGTRPGGMMHSMPGMTGGMRGGMMMAGCGCCGGGSSGGMCGRGMMQHPGGQHDMPHDPMFDENPQSTPAPQTPTPPTPAQP